MYNAATGVVQGVAELPEYSVLPGVDCLVQRAVGPVRSTGRI